MNDVRIAFGACGRSARIRRRGMATIILAGYLVGAAAPAHATGPTTSSSGSGTCAAARPTPQQIYSCLNLPVVPADYVVLIDTSGSMQSSGLYAQVLHALPALLNSLATNPGTSVALATFDAGVKETHSMGPVGDVAADVAALPSSANGARTDFGNALNYAYGQLNSPSTRAGAVILLSDGQLSTDPSSPWATYGNSHWNQLRDKFTSLGSRMALNGYGIELTPDTDLGRVLGQVFPNPMTFNTDSAALADALARTQADVDRVRATEVLQREDANTAVSARFTAVDGTQAGLRHLDLSHRHSTVRLTLSTTASHVPLVVTNIKVTSAQFPMQAQPESTTVTLEPGNSQSSRSITVDLTWSVPDSGSVSGNEVSRQTVLTVTGTVSSPWTETIRGELGDSSFTVGGLAGSSATLEADEPGHVDWTELVLIVVAALAGLTLLIGACVALVRYFSRPRLRGSLTVVGTDNRQLGTVPLSGRRDRIDARRLDGMPATATVRAVRSGLRRDGVEITCERLDIAAGPETRRLRTGEERVLRGLRFAYEDLRGDKGPSTGYKEL